MDNSDDWKGVIKAFAFEPKSSEASIEAIHI